MTNHSSPSPADDPANTAGHDGDQTIDLPASQSLHPRAAVDSAAGRSAASYDDHATTPPSGGEPLSAGSHLALEPRSAPPAVRHLSDPLISSELGGVTLVRMIAEGGMGRVYEGRQEKPRRAVAVKVIKPGLTSPELLKRFDYEAQVLGRLRHPGIAQIYTVGTHEISGQTVPFFVMEYIPNAKSLTQYANERKLSSHERLALFAKVCDAVAHGHQKGVIHRDLKPGNVLVDSSGQPKVIDFGVARSTDGDLALTMQTDVGALIGTLQYMSPEQFDADANDLDVRLDVYALGVILYELLTGQPPYSVKQRAIYEVARIVQQDDPTPISSLNKTLRRDVAVIAAKCLQKDRTRRYSSATELGGDVERYLAGEPITAVPPTFWDGLLRLARRHKTAAVAVTAIAVSLVVAVAGISAFALRAERAREEAELARNDAEQAKDSAELAKAAESEQREAAEESAKRAEASAREANERLYMSTLYKLGTAISSATQRGLAKKTWDEALRVYQAVHGADADPPLELMLQRPLLDGSLAVLEGHQDSVSSVAFSPDGTRLVTGLHDNTARLWDAATGEQIAVIEGHEGPVLSVAFSPDGTQFATGSYDSTARLWDATTGEQLTALGGHQREVRSVAFSPDGTRLATGSADNTARLWDVATGEQVATLEGHENWVFSVAFSPDSARLATGSADNTARLWDVATGEQLAALEGHENWVFSVAFSPNGTSLATGSQDKTARLWDAAAGGSLAVLGGHQREVRSVAFSPDGARLATGSGDSTARLWDVATGEQLAALEGHENGVFSVAFSPEGTSLAAGSQDNATRIWDSATGEQVEALEGHEKWVSSVVFSPDGTRLATGSADNTARLWDTATSKQLAVLEGHTDCVFSIAISSDGTRLATGSADNTARLWDAATGKQLAVLEGPEKWVLSVVFSPDGTRLATGELDNTARVWDTATGEQIAVLEGHEGDVFSIVFSPDGTRLATGSADETARLWGATTGEPIAVFEGHEGAVLSVAFSPDGTRLATGSADGTARLWGLSNAEIHRNRIAAAKARRRLGPVVDSWLAAGPADAKVTLDAAKATLATDDWHQAANLLLEKASSQPRATPPR
jgi:WD40 repeat protein/tRNA A-37 threonylcarbamoyl transferase component Bud32